MNTKGAGKMKNYKIMLSGKNQHCVEVLEKLGREVPPTHADTQGGAYSLKDAVAYINADGRRQMEFPPHYGGLRVEKGVVYKCHSPRTIFVDSSESFYAATFYGGKITLTPEDAIAGGFAGVTGEVVEISGCPVFRMVNKAGQYTGHLLSTIAVKKLRRKVEEKLRKGSNSLILRTAEACGVSLI